MAWIESHQALGRHPKTQQLATLLKVKLPTAIGHLHLFWWWALDFAPTGAIPNATPVLIARAAEWTGDSDRFWLAMVQSGFIDVNEECVTIHDWLDYAGRLIYKRAANAERMRAKRATHTTRTAPARVQHVQGLPTVPTGDSIAVSLNQPTQTLVTANDADAQGPSGTASAPSTAQTCPMCNRVFIGPYSEHHCAISRPSRGGGLSKLFGRRSDISAEELDRVERELADYRNSLAAQAESPSASAS